jgi:hypothetical protein
MIYSRTARKEDIANLGITQMLEWYMGIPKMDGSYQDSDYKFWEYALTLKLIHDFRLDLTGKKLELMNLVISPDIVFQNIVNSLSEANYQERRLEDLLKMPVRNNKFDIVCAFGLIEHTDYSHTVFCDKIGKHVNIDGYLVMTTDHYTPKNSKRFELDTSSMIDFSVIFEQLGYEFVSSEFSHSVDYNDNNRLHSLVMKRIGR